jgi:acetyl esterase/lipase
MYNRPTQDPTNRLLGRDLTGLPPIYLQYSEEEMFAAENRQFVQELRAAGQNPAVHADAGSFHVLALLPGLMARARAAVGDIVDFSRQAIATAARRSNAGDNAG